MVAGELRWKFQSTPPVKAATISYTLSVWDSLISIHAAREGGDGFKRLHEYQYIFQSTPPVKAATPARLQNLFHAAISIHAAREGGDRNKERNRDGDNISIHAAREGGDCGNE